MLKYCRNPNFQGSGNILVNKETEENVMEKMWALLVHLGRNMYGENGEFGDGVYTHLNFDEEIWNRIVDSCVEHGLNTIVMPLGEGVRFNSHPELAVPDAWTWGKLNSEVKRLAKLGITMIPKLNFSTTHDKWLKDYAYMVSTPTYYRVCRELIHEVYEMFDHPPYIHLGMDEEDVPHQADRELCRVRQGELKWHDFHFLCDCVRETGATPWVWADFYYNFADEFRQRVGKDVILSPWQYNALRKEHYTPVSSRQAYVDYYQQERYRDMNIQFVEQDPFLVNARKHMKPMIDDGYQIVPCISWVNYCEYNAPDTLEYYKNNAKDEQIPGFIAAAWRFVGKQYEDEILRNITNLAEARDMFWK